MSSWGGNGWSVSNHFFLPPEDHEWSLTDPKWGRIDRHLWKVNHTESGRSTYVNMPEDADEWLVLAVGRIMLGDRELEP